MLAACAASVPSRMPDSLVANEPETMNWDDWAKWVDKQHSVGDGRGHGPDIGSSEWAGALDRRLGISDEAGHGPDLGSEEWRLAVERKLHESR